MKISFLDELNIPYIIRKKKCKNLSIRFDEYGNLIITQPIIMSDISRDIFLKNHLNWIIKHYNNTKIIRTNYQSGDSYLLLGKEYTLDLFYNKHESVEILDNRILVYFSDLSHVEKLLNKFRYDRAEIIFNELLFKCYNNMNLKNSFPKLIIKKSKSRWGCCYYKKNEVMLNISLIHTPLHLIEYVVYHELAHFIHPDHSKDFHKVLQKYVPLEKQCRKELKNYLTLYH